MNRQEIFTKVYLGLRAQSRKGINAKGNCAYNGADGIRCGVGMLVTPEIAAVWDGCPDTSIDCILRKYREDVSEGYDPVAGVEPWMLEHQGLLDKIQDAHDGLSEEHGEWDDPLFGFEHTFAQLAREENLIVPA